MKIITFYGRVPSVDRIKVGNEMDNLAEIIHFDLPEWSDAVVSLYISNGKYSDVILLGSDRIYQPKREHTQHPGRWTAYLEAQRDGDVVWHSDTFALVIGDLPPTGDKVKQAYPTAVETAMRAAAQTLRDKEATEEARKAAEDAADAAGTAAGIAHGAAMDADNAAQSANNAANNAAQSAQSAANAAQSAAEIEQRTAQKVTEINDSISRIAVDVETLAPGSEATAKSSISPADGISIKLGVPRGEKGEKGDTGEKGEKGDTGAAGLDAPQIDDTQASPDHPWSGEKVAEVANGLSDAILSGTKENAAYHLGFYLDENGELCEVEDDV